LFPLWRNENSTPQSGVKSPRKILLQGGRDLKSDYEKKARKPKLTEAALKSQKKSPFFCSAGQQKGCERSSKTVRQVAEK
jgi:hypothetical protein